MYYYEVKNKVTGATWQGPARSKKAALGKTRWPEGDCLVKKLKNVTRPSEGV
jgi:hypothetical protein